MFSFKKLSGASWRTLSLSLHAAGCAVACALVIAGWGLQSFQASEQARIQRARARAEECLTNAADTERSHQELRHQHQQKTARIEQLLRRLPSAPEESQFLTQLADHSQKCDFHVRSFRPGGVTSSGAFGQMEITLAGDGSYESLCQFLAGLETLPRLCRVAGMTISGASETGERCTVEIQLQLLFSRPTTPDPVAT